MKIDVIDSGEKDSSEGDSDGLMLLSKTERGKKLCCTHHNEYPTYSRTQNLRKTGQIKAIFATHDCDDRSLVDVEMPEQNSSRKKALND